MKNVPVIKIGIVAVSRDCFPESLAVNRRKAVIAEYEKKFGKDGIYECPITIVESEIHAQQALEDVKKAGCNALCVYLGNFGPEISETMIADWFQGPTMFCAAAEESQKDLIDGRGDAYCGMLISFGPRPNNFLACNAPIRALYDLDVEIEENSELDLLEAFQKHQGDPRIDDVVKDMAAELGTGNKIPSVLPKHRLDRGSQGLTPVRGYGQQVLACFPDHVRLRTLLRQQPSHGSWHPRCLRG